MAVAGLLAATILVDELETHPGGKLKRGTKAFCGAAGEAYSM
jgi:hypothetical protein